MGAVLCFDTRTLTITSRAFYKYLGIPPTVLGILFHTHWGEGGHSDSELTVYVGLEQMFYDINGKVYIYELIDNLSTYFSGANNEHSHGTGVDGVNGDGRAVKAKVVADLASEEGMLAADKVVAGFK